MEKVRFGKYEIVVLTSNGQLALKRVIGFKHEGTLWYAVSADKVAGAVWSNPLEVIDHIPSKLQDVYPALVRKYQSLARKKDGKEELVQPSNITVHTVKVKGYSMESCVSNIKSYIDDWWENYRVEQVSKEANLICTNRPWKTYHPRGRITGLDEESMKLLERKLFLRKLRVG